VALSIAAGGERVGGIWQMEAHAGVTYHTHRSYLECGQLRAVIQPPWGYSGRGRPPLMVLSKGGATVKRGWEFLDAGTPTSEVLPHALSMAILCGVLTGHKYVTPEEKR
jgi:hypothetical protein